MRFLFRLLGTIVLILPFILVIGAYLSLQDQPLVEHAVTLSHSNIARAKKVIKENDPRQLKEGQKKSVSLSAQDISIALNYLQSQFGHLKGGVETKFSAQTIYIDGTAILPSDPAKKYLNFQLSLVQGQDNLVIDQFSIGEIKIPAILIQGALSLYAKSGYGEQYAAITNMLHSANINQQHLKVSYIWNAGTVAQLKDMLITTQDKEALNAYQQQLHTVVGGLSKNRKYSYTVILQPMFHYASERSVSNDPVVENRALLTVLTAYIKGTSIQRLTGTTQKQAAGLKLVLNNRHDFVEHFTISAGLTVAAGSGLADAVGLYKEHEDKKVKSGFSFTDLAADRAGVRLGELATASDVSARRIQKFMSSKKLSESLFMPKTRDLPEGINAATFKSRYQDGKGAEYQRIIDLIEMRIAALAIN